MSPNLASGLLCVEKWIRELTLELGRPADCLEWPRPIDAQYGQMMMAGIVPLKIWRGGEFRIVEFQRGELVDKEGDPEIHRRLGEKIRGGLESDIL
jgi:hypothetical protein